MIIERAKEDPLSILQENSFSLTPVRFINTGRFSEIDVSFSVLIETVRQNWWIYLNLAAQLYYYDVLSVDQNEKIWSRIFITEDNAVSIAVLAKLFKYIDCFTARTDLEDREVLNIQVCGLQSDGRAVFNALKEEHILAREIADFYNLSVETKEWTEGLYSVKAEKSDQYLENSLMDELISNPYFRSLDVTPFEENTNKEKLLKYVLSRRKHVYLYVNKIPNLICTKTLIWL